jgi:RNA polymerase sigma-70 factor (ECF subfamily)
MDSKTLIRKYWLARMRKGDSESFAKLYDELVDSIFRFALFKVSSVEDAEDITSQTFLKVWEYLQGEGAHEVRSVRAFVYRTTRNLIVDHYRARVETVSIDEEEGTIQSIETLVDANFLDRAEERHNLELLYRALKRLKDEYREIIILKYVDGLSTREIAEVLEKNANAVRAQLFRALAALKTELPNETLPFNERTTTHKKLKSV